MTTSSKYKAYLSEGCRWTMFLDSIHNSVLNKMEIAMWSLDTYQQVEIWQTFVIHIAVIARAVNYKYFLQ